MLTLLSGQNDQKTYRGRVFGGVRFTITAVASATATPLTASVINLPSLTATATLNRSGKPHQIMSINGDHLGAGCFEDANFAFFDPATTDNAGFILTTASAVGVNEVGQVVVDFPFGSPIDVRAGGEISLSAQIASGIFSSALNQSTSNVTVDLYETEGAEIGLPKILVQPIQANETTPQFSAGDGVRKLVFLNRDKGGITTANQVLTSINVDTNGVKKTMNYNQLLSERGKQFQSKSESVGRSQSFAIIPFNSDKIYYGVNVSGSSNASNVTSAKNYFVAWITCPSAQSVNIGRSWTAEKGDKNRRYLNQA